MMAGLPHLSVDMPVEPTPVLFEAVCTPPRSLGRRGTLLVAGLVVAGSGAVGVVFLVLGAWPVLGFCGLEAALVLSLLAAYRRWSRRTREVLLLTANRLVIRRSDVRGRPEEWTLDPYWARLSLLERPGRVSSLVLRHRGRDLEIGRLLGEEQKRDLATALEAALRRQREPVFDNPQLRDG